MHKYHNHIKSLKKIVICAHIKVNKRKKKVESTFYCAVVFLIRIYTHSFITIQMYLLVTVPQLAYNTINMKNK